MNHPTRWRNGQFHINTYHIAVGCWRSRFALCLDRSKPFAARLADGDVFNLTFHHPAVAVTAPADFGQEDAIISLLQLDALRVTETIT